MFSKRKTPDPSDVCLGNRYHNGTVFGGTLFTRNTVTLTFLTAMYGTSLQNSATRGKWFQGKP